MNWSAKTGRVKENEMHAQTMDHSDVADTEADNSVTSRTELCIIINLEFTSESANAERPETGKRYNLEGDPKVLLGNI
jgi:hypothetical protein